MRSVLRKYGRVRDTENELLWTTWPEQSLQLELSERDGRWFWNSQPAGESTIHAAIPRQLRCLDGRLEGIEKGTSTFNNMFHNDMPMIATRKISSFQHPSNLANFNYSARKVL